jgi:hypothetical protein
MIRATFTCPGESRSRRPRWWPAPAAWVPRSKAAALTTGAVVGGILWSEVAPVLCPTVDVLSVVLADVVLSAHVVSPGSRMGEERRPGPGGAGLADR